MFYNIYKKECPLCGEKLDCNGIAYYFKGNQDEYSICNHCHTSFVFYIRYGQVLEYYKTEKDTETEERIEMLKWEN